MPIRFEDYAQIKNRYCIAYFGSETEILKDLIKAREIIEMHFPEIEVHIACKDVLYPLLKDQKNKVPESQLRDKRREYAYIRMLNYNLKTNPVIELLRESGIEVSKL